MKFFNSCYIPQGGFSTVYQVQSTITGEVFAAKVIGKKHLSNANKKARVRNEIEIHSAVSGHPNILDFRGSFKSGENVCILTKICLKHVMYFLIYFPFACLYTALNTVKHYIF